MGRRLGFGIDLSEDLGRIAHPAKFKGGSAGRQDNAVKRSHQAKKPDDDQGMVDPMASPYDLFYGQWQGGIRGGLASAGIDDAFPSADAYRRGEGEKTKHHQGKQRGTKTDQDISLGIDGFLRHIGYPFYGEKEPDGKGNGRKDAQIAVGQGILLEVFPFDLGQTDTGKEDQAHHRNDGDHQLKGRRHLESGDIQSRKDQIGGNGNHQRIDLGKKEVEIAPNGRGNRGRGKDKFNVLGHAGEKSQVFAQAPFGIGKGPAWPGDGAGHFRIAKGKGDVHDNDKKSGDGQAERAAFRQA